MIWLFIIALFVCLFLGWLFFSRIVLEVDTRIARAELRWQGIGVVKVWYDDEWWLSMKVPFYAKTMRFVEIKTRKRREGSQKKRKSKKWKLTRLLKKIIRVIKTFKVTEWQIAIDTGDYERNAQFYPLNFLKHGFGHLYINFNEENFLVLKIYNRPWKMVYAFLK